MGSDDAGFAEFVVAQQAGLLRLATLLAGDTGHGEDLLQTALLKVYRRWGRVSRLEHPAAYARRVLVTTHTSWCRRLSTSEQVMESLPDHADPAASVEVDHDLRVALQALPPRMRAALVLRYFADLTEEQTAQVMGCATSTVNTQVVRGLARLRTVLAAPQDALAPAPPTPTPRNTDAAPYTWIVREDLP
ncbi:SigE family RNA polymerase sigma factor [Geodermatophilus sp. FMUSA9-8]|uniref:SigE family RNA polymerase sigma factor n=1 Tax=Geodermatophilus sp. FMUSA9-8 TaxID=3120155 RepID=UPI0030083F9A